MKNNRRKFLSSVAFLTAFGFLLAVPCRAQQGHELSDRYAHAGLRALHAIQAAGTSAPNGDISMASEAIDAAESIASTDGERRVSAILHQIYSLRLHDNDLAAAYQRVIEVESFRDDSESKQTRASKDYAASQLTDTLEDMQNREDRCVRQLETSLNQRSLRGFGGCSASAQ